MVRGTSSEPRVVASPPGVGPHSPVAALAPRAALTVTESRPIAAVVEVMQGASVSALVVGASAGIVTERDVARALAAGRSPADPVHLITTFHPVSIASDATVLAAAELMLTEEVRHLLINVDERTVAVVSMRDVLAVLLQAVDPHQWLPTLRTAVEPPTEMWLG